ncbi:hypothetical protein AGMMS49944_05470 [Spirochaetia bacterium]|nr:hypothetical protein AGMMS49944_05470 [Spirochaetia bacterium]
MVSMNPATQQPKQTEYEPQFYSVKQTAQLLGCSKANVSVQIRKGTIPAVRIGAYPYVGKAYIDALIVKANGGAAV